MRTLSFDVIVDSRFDDPYCLREILAENLYAYEEAFHDLGVFAKFSPFEEVSFPPETPYFRIGDENILAPDNIAERASLKAQLQEKYNREPELVIPPESKQLRCTVFVQKKKNKLSWDQVMHSINSISPAKFKFINVNDMYMSQHR